MATVHARHPFTHVWRNERRVEQRTRIQGERADQGGSEGWPAERLAGGRWDRRYRAWTAAFDRLPREEEHIVDGIDNADMTISSVEHEQLPPYAGIVSLLCRRTRAVRTGAVR